MFLGSKVPVVCTSKVLGISTLLCAIKCMLIASVIDTRTTFSLFEFTIKQLSILEIEEFNTESKWVGNDLVGFLYTTINTNMSYESMTIPPNHIVLTLERHIRNVARFNFFVCCSNPSVITA